METKEQKTPLIVAVSVRPAKPIPSLSMRLELFRKEQAERAVERMVRLARVRRN